LKPGAALEQRRQAIELRCAPGGAAITFIWIFANLLLNLLSLVRNLVEVLRAMKTTFFVGDGLASKLAFPARP